MKVIDIVNEIILKALVKGVPPWRKDWVTSTGENGPINGYSKKPYRGINIHILGCMPYNCAYWMTPKQIFEKGGRIIEGARSTPIVFWHWLDKVKGKDVKQFPYLRYFKVFNLEQTTLPIPTSEPRPKVDPIPALDVIVANYHNGPDIQFKGNQPCYSPILDAVRIPPIDQFNHANGYYAALLHELGHSTGHKSRLNRDMTGGFRAKDYAREELVAEITASALANEAGLQVDWDNSAAYLQNWATRLQDDPNCYVWAAGHAQKAVDLILNRTPDYVEKEVNVDEQIAVAS